MSGFTVSIANADGVKFHQIRDMLQITSILHKENIIGDEILNTVKNQVSSS